MEVRPRRPGVQGTPPVEARSWAVVATPQLVAAAAGAVGRAAGGQLGVTAGVGVLAAAAVVVAVVVRVAAGVAVAARGDGDDICCLCRLSITWSTCCSSQRCRSHGEGCRSQGGTFS